MNRLVALGDLLGFKNTILHNDVEVVRQDFLGFFRRAMQHAMEAKGWPDPPADFASLRAQSSLGVEWFSDTIILYTKTDTDEAATNLLRVVTWLLFETMYHHATRLRFGIDYGELHADTNAGQLVGKALVRAHELEKNQQWAGGALTKDAMDRLPPPARHYTTPYAVPLKTTACASSAAINWTLGVHQGLHVPFSLDRDTPNEHDPRDVVEKWQNTMRFHTDTCHTCNPNIGQTPQHNYGS
jgi:hypothetical protein